MKRKMLFFSGIVSVVLLSSCLKDTPFLTVDNTTPLIQFGLSPVDGNSGSKYGGPFLYKGDSAGAANIDTAIALVIASPQVLNKDVKITVRLDPSQITAYNTKVNASYTMLAANLFTLKDSVITIPAGYRVGRIPVTLNLASFPGAPHTYALPLTIVDGGGLQINTTQNSNDFMWLFKR